MYTNISETIQRFKFQLPCVLNALPYLQQIKQLDEMLEICKQKLLLNQQVQNSQGDSHYVHPSPPPPARLEACAPGGKPQPSQNIDPPR